jgi:hypothetical protein
VGVGEPEDKPPESRGDDDEPRKQPGPPHPGDNLLGIRNRAIVGLVFAALYIVTFGPRTGWVPGVLSGVLGGIVLFLLLREVDERRKRRRR